MPLHLLRCSAASESKFPVISIKRNVQFLPKAPVSTSYLQTLLYQLAIRSEASRASLSACFCSGLHSNSVSNCCLCELGLIKILSEECNITENQKIQLSLGFLVSGRVSKNSHLFPTVWSISLVSPGNIIPQNLTHWDYHIVQLCLSTRHYLSVWKT